MALTELRFGSNTTQVSTTAARDDDTRVLNGAKLPAAYCASGHVLVFATVDKSAGRQGHNTSMVLVWPRCRERQGERVLAVSTG